MAGKKHNSIAYIALSILALLLTASCFYLDITVKAAQEASFQLNTDSLNMQKGVSCNIVVSLQNARDAQVTAIEGLEEFDILSQSQSSSTSIVNNVATTKVDLYYTIMPKTAGQYTLKAKIRYEGQSYETNTLQVNVAEGSSLTDSVLPDLFVETVLSHEEAYLGEKIVLSYVLYSRAQVESMGLTDYLAIDGAIVKEMPNDQLQSETVYLDGERYTKYEVKQLIIDPLRFGICQVPSFNLQVNIISENRIGGGLFGGILSTTQPYYLQTEPRELQVKALPSQGRPSDFSGIVGDLQLSAHYNRDRINYGDSLLLQIELSGRCNPAALKNVLGDDIEGFTVYETQKSLQEYVQNDQYHAQRIIEAILVPEMAGDIVLAPMTISYFNPTTSRYELAEIPGTTVTVLGEARPAQAEIGNPSYVTGMGMETETVKETIRIEQVHYAAEANGDYLTFSLPTSWLKGAAIATAMLILVSIAALKLYTNRKKAEPLLSSAYRQAMRAKDIDEIYNLFNTMIKHRYHLNLKACSRNMIRSGLADAEAAARIVEIMEFMESEQAEQDKGYQHLQQQIKSFYLAKLQGR